MKYLLLIYDNEGKNMSMSPEAMSEKLDEWFKYIDELRASGILLD